MIKVYVEITTPIAVEKISQLEEQFGVEIKPLEHFYEIKAQEATVFFFLGRNWPVKI